MNISQQIADWIAAQGIEQVFAVTGGGSMYLNQAFGNHPRLRCSYMHHEQACAMAAEGYARVSGKPAVVNVTTGPGGINALNGVFGAWTDSIPMLVVSGQVKRETCLDFVEVPGLRQLGDQEGPVVHMARHICKQASVVRSAEELETLLPQALTSATTGRPGPVWIDIPLDIQSSSQELCFSPLLPHLPTPPDDTDINAVIECLRKAHRPLILAGSGVRIGKAEAHLLRFIEHTGIPLATAWAHDLISSEHPLFAGRPGTIGTRPGNFCLQAADCVIVIGSRLNIRQVSYNWKSFAKNAHIVQVDIDPAELKKPLVRPHLAIVADACKFLDKLSSAITNAPRLPDYSEWSSWCRSVHTRHQETRSVAISEERLNPYGVIDRIFKRLRYDDIIVCGNASACIIPFQVGMLLAGQQMFSNSGAASMGHDLPAAIGAAVAAPERRVICFAGDGSLQMNIQELQTLKTLGCRIVVIVIANGGYLSIRQTHESFFDRIVGATPDSGVGVPDFAAVAHAYGIESVRIANTQQLPQLDAVLNSSGPFLVQIDVDPNQGFEPRIKSRALADGTFSTPELDDMYPFLPADDLTAVRTEALSLRARRRE